MEAGTPKGPEGERRPADANARAAMISKIATEQIEDVRPETEALLDRAPSCIGARDAA